MKQVVRKGLRDIVVDEVPDPIPGTNHVAVRPVCSVISSGTETASIHSDSLVKEVADNPSHVRKILDVMKVMGPLRTLSEVRAKFSEYAVLGYSGAGTIVEKHPTVTDLKPGDPVAYGGEGTGHGEHIVTARNLVARIPEGVSFEQAAFTTLGSIALNAVRIASVSIGETVAVIGLGPVGQLISQLVRVQGGVVVAVDLQESRYALACQLGAGHGLRGGEGAVEGIRSLTNGRGADCVIVAAAAKSSAPCHQALAMCRDRGRIVVVGAVDMSFPWNDMYLKEIQLFMARAYGPGSYDPRYEIQGQDYPLPYVRWTENRNMEEFLRLLAQGQVQVTPLVTHRFALDDASEAYQTILNPDAHSMSVILQYREPPPEGVPVRRRIEIPGAQPAKTGEIQVALVGAGNLAKWAHLPNLQRQPGVRLRAVHSNNGARGKSYGRRFQAAYVCTDYQEILSDPAIDAVVITSRNQHHAAQTVAALEAGKHVFVEKPLALTLEECRRIHEALISSGRQLTVGFNRRYAPLYRGLKQALAGRSGPAVVQCRMNSPGISGNYWMADPAIGGAILGEACHFVDLMYWLLDSEPLRVSAYSLPAAQKDPAGENSLAASFQFADGSIGNLTYCTVGSKTSGGERVEVFAPGVGAMSEDFMRLEIARGMRSKQRLIWPKRGYEEQLGEFFQGIRDGRPGGVTALDGIRATVGCIRMLESARALAPCEMNLDAALTGE
jgi:predicted dehydrogenase/threonine dehydrogenase-like Zn-dependent dehydrogenase